MKYLKVFTDFAEILEPLQDAEIGRLFRAMLEYAENRIAPDFRGNEKFVWNAAKQIIDRERNFCDKQEQNGKKGGRPKKPNETQRNPTKPNETQKTQKDKDKDKDNDRKEMDTDVSMKKTTAFQPPTVDQVKAYCNDRGNHVDAQAFVDFYTSKGWMIGKNKMRDWKAAVRTWERIDDQPKAKQPERIDKTANLKKLYDELGDD